MKTRPDRPMEAVPGPPAPSTAAAKSGAVLAERRALDIFALIALGVALWLARPVAIGILLGMLTAFALQPFYERLAVRTRRPAVAAALCVLLSTLGSIAVIGALSSLFIARGAGMAKALLVSLAPGGGGRLFAERFSLRLGPFQLQPDEVTARFQQAATAIESRAAGIAARVASATFEGLLALFFAMMTLSFILQHWRNLAVRAEALLPIRPRYTRELLVEFQRVGRTTLLGTVLTGVAQGLFAGVGYGITRVPEATFLGAATAVASLLPGVGTMLVWIPAGAWLIGTGHVFLGIVELSWGSLIVVGLSDYVIRPRLVGGEGPLPVLLTFVALFGGVELFGLSGLIIGPLLMSVSFGVLEIFAQDVEERRLSGERHV